MSKLFYQGHGSYRLVSDEGIVVYIDPYAGEGYDLTADLVLISHEHGDHNQVNLIHQGKDCRILRPENMLRAGVYESLTIHGITIEAVPAYNDTHDRNACVGYVILMDDKKIYASGDTSCTDYMREKLSQEQLDYAFLPIDGIYNMNPEEASQCAKIIGAKHTIPIHMKPGALFDRKMAEAFEAQGRIIVEPNQEVEL